MINTELLLIGAFCFFIGVLAYSGWQATHISD